MIDICSCFTSDYDKYSCIAVIMIIAMWSPKLIIFLSHMLSVINLTEFCQRNHINRTLHSLFYT